MTEQMRDERRRVRRLMAVVFLLVLPPAVLGRLTGWRWQPWPLTRGGARSAVGAAREKASTIAQLAFAGL